MNAVIHEVIVVYPIARGIFQIDAVMTVFLDFVPRDRVI